MREKLRYSQDLLEGLMTSNSAELVKASDALIETTKLPAWAILETPEYERYSSAFLRATLKLRQAAQQRHSDDAFKAYLEVNTSCYQCHQYMKGQRYAR
jgi:hypothetical protein